MNQSSGAQDAIATQLLPVLVALRTALGEKLVSVVLFGSQARGEGGENSDWDLLLIARDLPTSTWTRHLALKRCLPSGWRGRIATVAKTPEEFEARLPALYLDIAHDGMILYDTEGYAVNKLKHIRRLQQQAGLVRRERRGERIWEWTTPPTGPWKIQWDGIDGIPT